MVRHDTGVGGGDGGGLMQPPLLPNVTKCKVEFTAPSVQNWPRERTCERHDGMSFAVQASLGDSCDVYRPASMTVGRGGGSVLFRQELGLSSDSKILLIYDVSTPIFSPTPLTPADKRPAGKRWHSVKLLVCLPLTFNAEDRVQARRLGAPPPFDLRVSEPNLVPWNILLIRLMKPYLKDHVHFLDLCCVVVGAFACFECPVWHWKPGGIWSS